MAKIPSIALIPSGYKATKIYSVLPVDGSADLTFDRGTSDDQTRVNKDGLIENVDQDVPRLDYLDGGCPSLLLEPASENLITYSEEFDNVAWSDLNVTVTSNQGVSPDGTQNADYLTFDNINNFHILYQVTTFTDNQDYTQSYFFKADGIKIIQIYSAGVGFTSASKYANFDLENGIIGESTFTYTDIKDFGNGWFKCIVSQEATANGTGVIGISGITSLTSDYRPQFQGDGISGLYVWGAQLEQQSYATSYVPSLGTSGVRAAETASKTGLSSYINSTEGVLYAETSSLANDGTDRVITLSNGTTSQRVTLFYSATSNRIEYSIVLGTLQASGNYTLTDATDFAKIALKYKENDFALYVNGLLVAVDTNGSTFSSGTLTKLAFDVGNGTFPFYGKTKDLRVYNEALSDLELATLTGFSSFAEMRDYLSYS